LPEAYPVSSRTGAPHGGRTNGTYHAAELHRERQRRTRLLIVIGGLVALISVVNVALTNADMTRIEQSGPERLALAGGGFEHFVPGILLNLPRANQSPSTVTAVLADDPRRTPAYVNDKRALERWMMLAGLGLSALFIGLETTIPASTAHPRSPTGTDMSRLVILVALAYGGLSFFEG
jgi:hypothetical protein